MIPFLPPSVKGMALRSYGPEPDTTLVQTVQRLTSLPADASISLSKLSLEWYSVGFPEMDTTLVPFLRKQHILRSLTLICASANIQLAGAIADLHALQELTLNFAFSSAYELQKFLQTLTSASNSLHKLKLGMLATSMADKVSFVSLRPLLRFEALKILIIYSSNGLAIEETDVREMGLAWQHAQLVDIKSRERSSRLPLSILKAFASSFGPSLTELRMEVAVDDIPTLETHTQRFPSLRTLYLGWSNVPLGQEEQLGTFLARICPQTTVITHGFGGRVNREESGGWYEVLTMRARIYDAEREEVEQEPPAASD